MTARSLPLLAVRRLLDPLRLRPRGDLDAQFAFSFLATGVVLAANLGTGVLIARLLDPVGRGEVTAITGAPALLGWIFALGAHQAVAFWHARRPDLGARLIGTWLVILTPIAIVAIGVGQLLVPVLLRAQTTFAQDAARVFMLTIAFLLLSEIVYGVLLGDQDFLFFNAMRVVQGVAPLIAFIVLWRMDRFTVLSAVVTLGVISIANPIIAGIRAIRRHGVGRPDVALGRATLSYGMRAHGGNVGSLVNYRLDLMILPAFVTAVSVGTYAVAASVAGIVGTIAGALAALVMPAAVRRGRDGGAVVRRSLQLTLVVGGALGVVLWLLARPAIHTVYGAEFDNSVTLLRIILPGALLFAAANVLCQGLSALYRPMTASIVQIAGAAVTIVGLVIFVPIGGANAAAVTSLVAYALVFVMAAVLYQRVTRKGWHHLPSGTDGKLTGVGP